MIVCKKCFKFDEPWEEAMFDYWQWCDETEDFYNSHGRYCDVCGEEFYDGQLVALTEMDMLSSKINIGE